MALSRPLVSSDNPFEVARKMREISKSFSEVGHCYIKWNENFQTLLGKFDVDGNFQNFIETAEKLKSKEMKENLDILFTGMTSSGKSALVNAILGKRILQSSPGHCTSCAITIQSTNEPRPFFNTDTNQSRVLLDLNSTESIREFRKQCDALNKSSSAGATVNLYIPCECLPECGMLQKNACIIDCPGMDQECFSSETSTIIVSDADALVIVIDVEKGLNSSHTWQLLEESNFLVRPSVLLVMNKCDLLDEEDEDRKSDLIDKAISDVISIIHNGKEKYCPENKGKDMTFFLSAKQECGRSYRESGLARSTVPCNGYELSDGMYIMNDGTRSLGFKRFETKLLKIAEENYLLKANRIIVAMNESFECLRNQLENVEKKLTFISGSLKQCSEERVPVSMDEANDIAQIYHHTVLREESISSGEGLVERFLAFCKESDSRTLNMFENRLSSISNLHIVKKKLFSGKQETVLKAERIRRFEDELGPTPQIERDYSTDEEDSAYDSDKKRRETDEWFCHEKRKLEEARITQNECHSEEWESKKQEINESYHELQRREVEMKEEFESRKHDLESSRLSYSTETVKPSEGFSDGLVATINSWEKYMQEETETTPSTAPVKQPSENVEKGNDLKTNKSYSTNAIQAASAIGTGIASCVNKYMEDSRKNNRLAETEAIEKRLLNLRIDYDKDMNEIRRRRAELGRESRQAEQKFEGSRKKEQLAYRNKLSELEHQRLDKLNQISLEEMKLGTKEVRRQCLEKEQHEMELSCRAEHHIACYKKIYLEWVTEIQEKTSEFCCDAVENVEYALNELRECLVEIKWFTSNSQAL